MKLLLLAAALNGTVAFGQQAPSEHFCMQLSNTARASMKVRQAGIPLSELLDVLNQQDVDENLRSLLRTVTVGAYDIPQYTTPRIQQEAITEYENDWLRACLSGL